MQLFKQDMELIKQEMELFKEETELFELFLWPYLICFCLSVNWLEILYGDPYGLTVQCSQFFQLITLKIYTVTNIVDYFENNFG